MGHIKPQAPKPDTPKPQTLNPPELDDRRCEVKAGVMATAPGPPGNARPSGLGFRVWGLFFFLGGGGVYGSGFGEYGLGRVQFQPIVRVGNWAPSQVLILLGCCHLRSSWCLCGDVQGGGARGGRMTRGEPSLPVLWCFHIEKALLAVLNRPTPSVFGQLCINIGFAHQLQSRAWPTPRLLRNHPTGKAERHSPMKVLQRLAAASPPAAPQSKNRGNFSVRHRQAPFWPLPDDA